MRMEHIGTRIRRLRFDARLTQGELGERAQLKQAHITNYETGRSVPTWASCRKLAKAFGLSPTALIDGADLTKPARTKRGKVKKFTHSYITATHPPARVYASSPSFSDPHQPFDSGAAVDSTDPLFRDLDLRPPGVSRDPYGAISLDPYAVVVRHLRNLLVHHLQYDREFAAAFIACLDACRDVVDASGSIRRDLAQVPTRRTAGAGGAVPPSRPAARARKS
jgi:transcriptional regulator with XRE-family HTH domain